MLHTLLGSKIKMTQTFVENKRTPVTVVKAGPCTVTQIKDMNKDGYFAVQLGFGERKFKNITKPLQGHLAPSHKASEAQVKKQTLPHFIKEVRLNEEAQVKVGDVVKISDVFAEGDTVQVTGISKGKGFQGGVKRHGFRGGPRTHGQSDRLRAPGSIGQGTNPGRVWKGKRMAGRMGNETVTIKNLKIIAVNPEANELHISGPIPGSFGKYVAIKRLSPKQEVQAEESGAQNG